MDYSIYRLGFMQMNSGEAMSIWLIPLVFIAQRERMPPVMLSRMLSQGINVGGVDLASLMGMDLLISIIPVALFLIFRKHINEWVLLAYTKIRY